FMQHPVMTLKKGTLLDNLGITDSSNATVATLSLQETAGILAHVVTSLFYLTFISEKGKLHAVPAFTPEQDEARWALIRLVTQRGLKSLADVRTEFDRAVAKLQPTTMQLVSDLKEFCEYFSTNYLIVAEVPLPPGNHVIVKYHKSIPLYGRT